MWAAPAYTFSTTSPTVSLQHFKDRDAGDDEGDSGDMETSPLDVLQVGTPSLPAVAISWPKACYRTS